MICNTCKKDKDESEFSFKVKATGKRAGKCKACHAKYAKKHYKANKSDYIARAKRDRPEQERKTRELLASMRTACVNCGETHPATLDFHHTDPSVKEANITMLDSRKKMLEEADKCVVLCSNCHRKLHYDLRNGGRTQIRTEKQIGLSYSGIPNSHHTPM